MGLTEDDRNWFAVLVRSSEERTAAQLRASEERTAVNIAAQVQASEERMAAKIEHTETALLTAFHRWASPVEMRLRTHSAAIRAADLAIEALSDRVTKLEPPQ